MTATDRYLQRVRMQKASAFIQPQASLLDIGCHQGELLLLLKDRLQLGWGVDPLCTTKTLAPHIHLWGGIFPQALPHQQTFDCITALAVFEHISTEEQMPFLHACYQSLKPGGKLILTVPQARVDKILSLLLFFKLVKGMSLEEHHAFDVNALPQLAVAAGFSMVTHQRFQFGLNNLFVFEKR